MNARLLVVIALLLVGCAGAKTQLAETPEYVGPAIHSIAVDSGAGVLGDAIKVELGARGFDVPDDPETADAVVHVTASGDYQGMPQSAAIRLVAHSTGELLAAVTWNNGWGGSSGSIADRVMRQGAPDAAKSIVNALCQKIAPDKVQGHPNKMRNR